MAYLQSWHFRVHSFWRNFICFGKDFTRPHRVQNNLSSIKSLDLIHLLSFQSVKISTTQVFVGSYHVIFLCKIKKAQPSVKVLVLLLLRRKHMLHKKFKIRLNRWRSRVKVHSATTTK
ncbi:hypothetical protein Patl1_35401 [Pistacia atlantica]|nr:hypothetical protein Patl1_35401 [Pistacia atlantica]